MICYCLIDCFQKTVHFNGLHQIINGTYFITIECIFRIRRCKDNQRIHGNALRKFYSGNSRHLNIKENQINRIFIYISRRCDSIIKATHQCQLWNLLHQ